MTDAPPPAKKPAAPKKPVTKSTAAAPKTPSAPKPAATKPAATKRAAAAATVAPTSAPVTPPPPPPPPPPAPAAPAAPVAPQAAPSGQPTPMLESEARTFAMLLHLIAAGAMLLSAGTLAFVAPLIIWLIYRDRSALVDFHGRNALNLHITTAIVMIGGSILGFAIFFGVGFILTGPLMLAYGIYALVIAIIAGVRAQNGEYYRIPFVFRFFN